MALNLVEIIVLLAFGALCIIIPSFFILRRRSNAYVLIVEKDLRNPNLKPQKFYAMFDKNDKLIKLYRNLFQPFETSIIPPFEMASYVHNRIIYCIKGATGKPEDDNIYPLHYPLVSAASANEMAKEISGAFLQNIEYMKDAKNFQINDEVEFVDLKKNKIKGRITNMDFKGLAITFNSSIIDFSVLNVGESELITDDFIDNKKKSRKAIGIIVSWPETSRVTNYTVHKRKPMESDYANAFFNTEWVMQTFGIVPINDVNVVLANIKQAVSSFNSKIIARRDAKQSWFARNQLVVAAFILFIGVAVSMAIVLQSTETYLNGVTAAGQASINNANNAALTAIQQIGHAAGVNVNVGTSSSTTTIPINTSIGQTPP